MQDVKIATNAVPPGVSLPSLLAHIIMLPGTENSEDLLDFLFSSGSHVLQDKIINKSLLQIINSQCSPESHGSRDCARRVS